MDYALFFILLCSSAFFSGSETAFFKLSALELAAFKEDLNKRRRIYVLRSNPRELLITILFGNELTNIALSIVSASIMSRLIPEASLTQQAITSSMIVVPILLICGEITPKTIASYASQRFAEAVVYPLSFFSWLITPARSILHIVADLLVRLLSRGKRPNEGDSLDELGFKALIEASVREGEVEVDEQTLIHNAFTFGDLTIEDVMRPWRDVFHLDATVHLDEALDQITAHEHSRVPMMKGESVIGVLHAKDLLAYRWGLRTEEEVRGLIRPTIFTPANVPLSDLMDRFKSKRRHLAIVLDEQGAPLGLCTLEDILEVLFGPINEREEESLA
jgi:putative hemolysin